MWRCTYPELAWSILCIVLLGGHAEAQQTAVFPAREWRVEPPQKLGWSAEKLQLAQQYADSLGSSAVLVVQRGIVIAAWGDVARPMPVHSIRKSLLNALIGMAVAEGKISLQSTLAQLDIDDEPPALSEGERSARVVDLLRSRSGVYHPAAYETPGMARLRPARDSRAPGSFWYYNNWDFNALGGIYERASGTSIFHAFEERIAIPLGMQDLGANDTAYFREPVSRFPAYTFRLSARDLARFGLLYARRGVWRGRQVVPAEWVDSSTALQSDIGILGGYGYMWWVARDDGEHYPVVRVPRGTFSARGTGEQNLVIIPAEDLVIVHRIDTETVPPPKWPHVVHFGRLLQLILAARPEGPHTAK